MIVTIKVMLENKFFFIYIFNKKLNAYLFIYLVFFIYNLNIKKYLKNIFGK